MTSPTPPEPAMPTTDLTEAPPLPEPEVESFTRDSVMRTYKLRTYSRSQMLDRDAMWSDRVRAAMSGASAEGWRDIATAPKDGTVIQVWNADRGGMWLAKYMPVYVSGYRPDNPWFCLMLNCHWHPNRYGSYVPTHWKPLDAPLAAAPTPTVKKENDRD